MEQTPEWKRVPPWIEQWAAHYCASRDILRVFRRATGTPSDHLRDLRAYEVMVEVLRRARRRGRNADEDARTLWAYACGLGRGRVTSVGNRKIDDAFLKVVDSADPARAINELVRDWHLDSALGAINRRLAADYGLAPTAKKIRELPLKPRTRLRRAEVHKILDAILSSADKLRKRKQKAKEGGLALGKRVEQRLQPLRKVTRIRSRKKV